VRQHRGQLWLLVVFIETVVLSNLRDAYLRRLVMRLRGLVIVVSVFLGWLMLTDLSSKIRSLLGAVCFYFIESTYVWFHGKPFHSTFAQFWNNIWSHPLIADIYFTGILSDSGPVVRIALYPLVIWGLELVQCTVLKSVYGRNIAWDYTGNRFSRFGGAIDLGMAIEWWLLGAAMEFIYARLAF
jgi:hypothetical protein